jgi:predicted dehydrogenase
MQKAELNIGIAGAGDFASFATKAFLKVPGIKIRGVVDINKMAAEQLANELNAKAYTDFEKFLADNRIELVYIATPPFLHYQQSKSALLAGKHVICEKPAALKSCEAGELAEIARASQLLYAVNLMQRYNPMYGVMKAIIKEEIFGNFLHGYFENYASDANLEQSHWFWDESKSGGIFIEHGVHFFDMFSGWLCDGKVISAAQLQRPHIEKKLIDRVQATVHYNGCAVNFYHGFDQPKLLDRQEMRLQFERGDVRMYGWIPVRMKMHGLLQKKQLERLGEMVPDLSIAHHNGSWSANQKVRGRFTDISFDHHVTLEYGNISEKQNRYQEMLAAMILDQWKWIIDRKHIRVIDDSNALESLKMAEEATRMAQRF